MRITISQLAEYALDRIDRGADHSHVAQTIASFLTDERRTREAPAVFRAIEKELAQRGRTHITLTSAYEVGTDAKQQIAELFNIENPVFETVIDPRVVGGVKARAGEHEIDLTVRAKLNRFKQIMTR